MTAIYNAVDFQRKVIYYLLDLFYKRGFNERLMMWKVKDRAEKEYEESLEENEKRVSEGRHMEAAV